MNVLRTIFYLIRDGTYTEHVVSSLNLILLGISIAITFGFILGLLMFRYMNFKIAMLPVIESIRGIAALTLFPLLIVLFGLGIFSRTFVIFWTDWPAVVLSTLNGLNVDNSIVEGAKICSADDWKIIFSVRIPMGVKYILTGIRIGVGGGW